MFSELIFRKLHYTCSLAIQRITYKICLGIILLENLISVTQTNVFGINSSIISGWRAIILVISVVFVKTLVTTFRVNGVNVCI